MSESSHRPSTTHTFHIDVSRTRSGVSASVIPFVADEGKLSQNQVETHGKVQKTAKASAAGLESWLLETVKGAESLIEAWSETVTGIVNAVTELTDKVAQSTDEREFAVGRPVLTYNVLTPDNAQIMFTGYLPTGSGVSAAKILNEVHASFKIAQEQPSEGSRRT